MIHDFYSLGKNNTNLLDKYAVLKSLEYDIDFEKEVFKKDKKTKENSSEKIPLYPVIINFNNKEDKIEIEYGKQEECKDYLCLEQDTSRGRKISFYTNSIVNQLSITLSEFILESEEKQPNKIEFISYLKNISDNFFKKHEIINENKKKALVSIMDFNKIKDESIRNSLLNLKISDKNFKKDIIELFNKKHFPDHNRTFLIKIDGEHILKSAFKEDYISVIYDYYLGDLLKNTKNGIYHVCNKGGKVLNEVKFPLKFYNLDKREFFQDLDVDNSSKSFSICGDCYLYVISGMKFLENTSKNNYYFGYKFMIIPKEPKNNEDYIFIKEKIKEQLTSKFGKENIEKLEKYKIDDLSFSLVFYDKKNAYFKIIKEINDISYFNIRKINRLLESANNELLIIDYNGNENYFGLGSIKEILYSNSQFKNENIIKELLEIIYAVYSNIPIDKSFLLNQILSNYKKNYFDNKFLKYNSANLLKSFVFIQFLIKNNNLEMRNMQIETYTKIQNKELLEFFEKNRNLNEIEKGLITFGFLINKIIYAQKEKNSTFLKKVGFDGLDVHDLKQLFSELEEYREIYKISKYDNAETSFVSEIISKIQKDSISPIEINYYILFGIELGKYIGIKMSEKTKQGGKNE
ncbi:MAG: TM1802 family CRISPR-associated protein [archaeon]